MRHGIFILLSHAMQDFHSVAFKHSNLSTFTLALQDHKWTIDGYVSIVRQIPDFQEKTLLPFEVYFPLILPSRKAHSYFRAVPLSEDVFVYAKQYLRVWSPYFWISVDSVCFNSAFCCDLGWSRVYSWLIPLVIEPECCSRRNRKQELQNLQRPSASSFVRSLREVRCSGIGRARDRSVRS